MWGRAMGQDSQTFSGWIQLAYFEDNQEISLIIPWWLTISTYIRIEKREMSGRASFIIFQVQF